MSKDLSERQNALLGVFAAVVEGIIVQPTVYYKNARAQGLPFTLNPRVLYRGTSANIVNEAQAMALQFVVASYLQKLSSSNGSHGNSGRDDLLGAMAGGMLTALLSSPIELVMIQQQLKGGTLASTPAHVVKQYGLGTRGLSRGLSVTIIRDAIYVGGMLGVTPVFQGYLEKNHGQSSTVASLNASLLGGIVAAVPSHPLDIVKTCMQGDLKQKVYKSPIATATTLYNQGGVYRLFHGCAWRSLNIILTVWIANECKNRLSLTFSTF
jgi:hypothetical protein